MALDRLKDTALPHVVSSVVADLADLFQKEMRLARAELSAKIATKLQAGVWMSAAGIMGVRCGVVSRAGRGLCASPTTASLCIGRA